ncbi:histidinol dehydrogenase [Halobacillus halophilus]|uniref:Histidinol dehydrogenase n=1 Tax=Halobacillus halophilus (strain ATCC 35676 / DSM 2266 / JCM 20832 / KCTC 3685 / LMG 17431 / NBRC 102448 / NCIMB 2269) TaxID=866895 RepID=I0JQE5_HALH3|nr:histidinol dehydrogenase [Halobacillus halophilus]ASF40381.1 histidinol dehydrogenase [Halobacillus halophilus]CCG46365.1 histidinol dehydrogenase [Halobacillus halophilus DSM 2266]
MKIIQKSDRVSLRRRVEQGTEEQRKTVQAIIEDVKSRGDEAVLNYTERFDGVKLDQYKVSPEEFEEAYEALDGEFVEILQEAAANIRRFHEKQRPASWFDSSEDGTILGQKITAIEAAGVYVPGGTAAYPSSVFMNVIPAQVAGVERIVMVTPPGKDGKVPDGVLLAAHILGVEDVYKVGGAQAIAALAYGTETVPAVDKITGPGNVFVALAKREVFGDVDIDMIAGPSEIAILADDTALASEVAADLLSQAEHDARSSSVLVTTSQQLAEQVQQEVKNQLEDLPRAEIARKSVEDYGMILLCETWGEAITTINEIAPEHLEIVTDEPFQHLGKIKNAGAIFLGPYSSEPVGDYFAGPNHVLPTNGTARFSSPLNVDDFLKKSSVISYSEDALKKHGDKIARYARLEGLEAHARAIDTRKERWK